MKILINISILAFIFSLSSCTSELSQTQSVSEAQLSFMKGEKVAPASNSYIINGTKHHPFLFRDQLEVVKDKSVTTENKSKLVYQTIKNHIELKGISDADQLDMQKLILFLYGDYSKIDSRITEISHEQHEYFLNALIDYKAIDFKYLAKISKHLKSKESYVLPTSKEYLAKYKGIVSEQGLNDTQGYGAHCYNIIESCNMAIEMLQNS